ncbi:MAG: GntR family transcriptional regulator [bacterium]|nr:GntR family transcriptional regulator [bacterium]
MDIIIMNSSDVPIYKQLKEQIKNLIITNKLKSGDKLPSIRVLARDLKISVITTKAAYEELERDGYVEIAPSKGVYVSCKNKELIREEQLQNIENLIKTSIDIAKISNISKDDINDIIDIYWEDLNE